MTRDSMKQDWDVESFNERQTTVFDQEHDRPVLYDAKGNALVKPRPVVGFTAPSERKRAAR